MSRPSILVTQPLPDALRARLDAVGILQDFTDAQAQRSPAFEQALAHADGVIGNGVVFDEARLATAPNLKVVSAISVGVDSYDLAAFARHGIVLCHTPDVLTDTVADTAMLLMLATARRAMMLSRLVRDGGWQTSIGPSHYGRDVHHARLGIVGMGRIGEAIARRAAAGFGMHVTYHNRSRQSAADEALGARWQPLETLLAESDFVCSVLPMSAATERLFDAAAFATMQPSAFFVNIGRGGVVDEPALIAALENGRIAGAGLDVFAREPLPADSPLLALDNVVALPHVGSATHATREAMAERAVDNLVAVLENRRPPSAYPLPD